MSKPKQDDDTVEAARSFLQQFAGLQKLAGMVDEVSSLRQELASLCEQREKAMAELSVLRGEKEGRLKALSEEIEARVRGEHAAAQRVLETEAALRKSVANLNEEVQDRRRVLSGLEAQIFRAEAAYGDLNTRLSALRGSIPVGA